MTPSHGAEYRIAETGSNDLGLEQFATSIAALAGDLTNPDTALDKALSGFVDNLNAAHGEQAYNTERLLEEKAASLGYHDLREFRRQLEWLIGERMIELHVSRLSAAQRLGRPAA